MIAVIARLTGLDSLAIRAVLIVLAVSAVWGWGFYRYAAGYGEGQRVERAAWEWDMRELRKVMESERNQAQDRIGSIEREYLDERQRDTSLILDLETAISAMESEDAGADTEPGEGAGAKDTSNLCRPAISGGLSRQLDAIGR